VDEKEPFNMEEQYIILSSDGEEFDIPITIAKQIKSLVQNDSFNSIQLLNVDSLLLDEIIRLLEQLETTDTPEFDETKIDAVIEAAITLDIPKIIDFFDNLKKNKRIIFYSWEEFCKHQSKEDFWILIDNQISQP